MRRRKEIEEDIEQEFWDNGELENRTGIPVNELVLEVLLDIRDLLNDEKQTKTYKDKVKREETYMEQAHSLEYKRS